MKGVDDSEDAFEQMEMSENALAAIAMWRDEAFTPALEELRDDQLTHLRYSGVKTLYEIVMAYDNEWAYRFIEDMFKDREKEMNRYSEALYQAFYEGGQRPRFLPLVEKDGERPLEWGDE